MARSSLRLLVFLTCLFPLAVFADGGPEHQVSSDSYGVSGGNVNHRSRAFCCGGTLGSLLVDSGAVQHILSNNHVLARTDQAQLGEDITQPGLIDNSCQPSEIVADLSAYPPLGSNVDAAIAQLRSGAMNSSGTILDVGDISTAVRSPTVGLAVAKSGRTTGFTTSTIEAVNANINVQYQAGCGMGRRFTVSYTGQIVIGGSGFSAGGDSGSLVVSNDGGCPQPVGLLFAGSSTSTIANPAGEVLTKVGNALGKSVSFAGSCISTSRIRRISPIESLPQEELNRADKILTQYRFELMEQPSVIGTAIGASPGTRNAEIVIYVDISEGLRPELPAELDGIPVRVVLTDPFVAF